MTQDQPTLEGLTADVKVTSGRLAQLEGAQIVTEERLKVGCTGFCKHTAKGHLVTS